MGQTKRQTFEWNGPTDRSVAYYVLKDKGCFKVMKCCERLLPRTLGLSRITTWVHNLGKYLLEIQVVGFLKYICHFLADRTIGRAYGTVCRLSSVCRLSVTFCVVAKRCVLDKKCLKE